MCNIDLNSPFPPPFPFSKVSHHRHDTYLRYLVRVKYPFSTDTSALPEKGYLGPHPHPPLPPKQPRVLRYVQLNSSPQLMFFHSIPDHIGLISNREVESSRQVSDHHKGIFSGHSTLLIGKINEGTGQEISVSTGDVIVLPAGTAHSCLESSEDYRYIGVYPEVSLFTTVHAIPIYLFLP